MTPIEWIVAGLAVAAGTAIHGGVGFGSMLVAAPILVLLDPRLVPGPALGAGLLLTALIFLRERTHVHVSGIRWILVGALPGVASGAYVVAVLPTGRLEIAFSTLVLVAVGMSVAGWTIRPTPATSCGAGLLAGFMGTATSIGGPPVALLYQREAGPTIRSTVNAFFFVATVLSLTSLAVVGEFGPDRILDGLALWPGVAVGIGLSGFTRRHVDRGRARAAVLLVAAAAAIIVLARAVS